MNIIVYALTGIFVAVLILNMIPVKCNASVIQEGFQNDSDLKTCPNGTRTFTDKKGNLSCCKGQVNGQTCEGTVFCSFSSNAGPNVPLCSGRAIVRKYKGPIDPFVKMIVNQNTLFLDKLLQFYMPDIVKELRKLPPSQISQKDVDRFEILMNDEKQWYKITIEDIISGKVTITKEEYNQFMEEELMYIMNQTIDIFKKSPIAKNQTFLQQQIQAQVCKK